MNTLINHQPTSATERIVTLDIIRAIALFGILLVNMKFFATPAIQAEMAGISFADSLLDKIAMWFIFIFAEFKFIAMFSLLFGVGFLLFMERGERRGTDVRKLFKRRLLILLSFGLIHIFFLWYGDILTFYAILGFILLWAWKKNPKSLLRAAFISITIPITLFFLLATLLFLADQSPSTEQQAIHDNEVSRIISVYSEGSYLDIFMQRMNDIAMMVFGNIFLGVLVMTMFFFGMYFWKTRIFTHTTENIARIRKIALISLLIGLTGTIIAIFGKLFIDGGESPWYFVQYGGLFMSAPSISIFYIMSLLLLLENKQRLRRVAQILQPVGKMALTNYLMQTVICTFIFYSYGLGMFGKLGPFYWIAITVSIYVVQIILSAIWFRHFQYGPMEWLWRRLTYRNSDIKMKSMKQAQ